LLGAGNLPERQMPIARKLAQRARIGQRFELAAHERGPQLAGPARS
jgi:hypothetical protein